MGKSQKYEQYYKAVKSRKDKDDDNDGDRRRRRTDQDRDDGRGERSNRDCRVRGNRDRDRGDRSNRDRDRGDRSNRDRDRGDLKRSASSDIERRSRSESNSGSKKRRRQDSSEEDNGDRDGDRRRNTRSRSRPRSRSRSKSVSRFRAQNKSKGYYKKEHKGSKKRRRRSPSSSSSSSNSSTSSSSESDDGKKGRRSIRQSRDGWINYRKNGGKEDRPRQGRSRERGGGRSRQYQNVHDLSVAELQAIVDQKMGHQGWQHRAHSPTPKKSYVRYRLDNYTAVAVLDTQETKTLAAKPGEIHIGRTETRSEEEREREGPYEDFRWNPEDKDEDGEDPSKWFLHDPMVVKVEDVFQLLQAVETLMPLLFRGMSSSDGCAAVILDKEISYYQRNVNAVSISIFRSHLRLCIRQFYRRKEDLGGPFKMRDAHHSNAGRALDLLDLQSFIKTLPNIYLTALDESNDMCHLLEQLVEHLGDDIKREELNTASVSSIVDLLLDKPREVEQLVMSSLNKFMDSSFYAKFRKNHAASLRVLLAIRALHEQYKVLEKKSKDGGRIVIPPWTQDRLDEARRRQRGSPSPTNPRRPPTPEKRPAAVSLRRRRRSHSQSRSPPRKRARSSDFSPSPSPPPLRRTRRDKQSTSTPASARELQPVPFKMPTDMSSIREGEEEQQQEGKTSKQSDGEKDNARGEREKSASGRQDAEVDDDEEEDTVIREAVEDEFLLDSSPNREDDEEDNSRRRRKNARK